MAYEVKQLSDGWYVVSVVNAWYGPYPSQAMANAAMLVLGGDK